MPGAHPGSTSGINPGGQGVIPRRFKRKKNFKSSLLIEGLRVSWEMCHMNVFFHLFLLISGTLSFQALIKLITM